MGLIGDKYIKEIEWEAISFPIEVTNLESQLGHYNIPCESKIKLWRDDHYRLKGLVYGVVKDKDDLEYKVDGVVFKGGFLKGENYRCYGEEHFYKINGLVIVSITSNYLYKKDGEDYFAFEADIILDSIIKIVDSTQYLNQFNEWYLSNLPKFIFPCQTERFKGLKQNKVRSSLDEPIEEKKEYSMTNDFFILKLDQFTIVVQEICDEFLPEWSNGLTIEYRDIKIVPDFKFRKMIRDFISFIFGTPMNKIGESSFGINYNLIESTSITNLNERFSEKSAMPAIPLIYNNSRKTIEVILNEIFKGFSLVYNELSLEDLIWKLNIGRTQPIGTNLPILSSGFETLIENFLKSKRVIKKYNKKEKSEYKDLIKDDIESLKKKIESYEFSEFVINKLNNPYNLGIGEKMKLFFKEIKLDFDKESVESKALKARNDMTHSKFDHDNLEGIHNIIKLSDAYISLINRVLLKIINYEGLYIDYYNKNSDYKKIDQNL